jgi:hypothetical protein
LFPRVGLLFALLSASSAAQNRGIAVQLDRPGD